MRVGETQAIFRHSIEMRGRNLGLGVIALRIPVTEVVCQDDDHMWQRWLFRGRRLSQQSQCVKVDREYRNGKDQGYDMMLIGRCYWGLHNSEGPFLCRFRPFRPFRSLLQGRKSTL